MGLSPEYFWRDLDDKELSALFKAHNKGSLDAWERSRFVAYHSVQWGKNPPSIQKFLPLNSDTSGAGKPKTKKLTKEQRSERAKGLANIINT